MVISEMCLPFDNVGEDLLFGRLCIVEVISNCDFLEMLLIASAFLSNVSSTRSGEAFFKTPVSMLIFSSSASSNNVAHDQ